MGKCYELSMFTWKKGRLQYLQIIEEVGKKLYICGEFIWAFIPIKFSTLCQISPENH